MNTYHPSSEEIRTVAHTVIDKRIWAAQLLSRVRAVMQAKGKDRLKELRQLELAIQMEIDESPGTKPLYHFILEHSEKLCEKISATHGPVSENDLFLCACIYLDISITDVSEIKSVDPSSVV